MLRSHIAAWIAAAAFPVFGAAPAITGLDLVDADTGMLIAPLLNNDTLDLNELGQRVFWVRANVSGAGSVHFHAGGRIERTVNSAPYIMGGSTNGTNGAWMPGPGSYTITATPWEGAGATGAQGEPVSVNLTVIDALDHRMRSVRIVSDVPHAKVYIRMLKHAFPFGSMTKEPADANDVQISQNATYDEQMYRATFHSNFNCSVAGNAMKWYTQQPDWWSLSPHNTGYSTPGNHRYDQADNWIDYHESVGTPVRGHTILWGEIGPLKETPTNQMQDPNWVEALGTNALYWIEQRISNIVTRYAGRIDEWDFNNELWHGDWYRDTFGNGITKQMADWAIAANPEIKLWFNEYGMLNNTNNAAAFLAHLQTLQGEGVRMDGVGVQGHFGLAPDEWEVKASLDILDDLGLPIKITEFDCGWEGATEIQEADGLETVYRTAFEHPAVAGIIMWGFWEGNHWKPERALWNTDWTPTEQAHRYRALVFDEWWSEADLFADQNGELHVNLFAGDFEITVDGKVFTNSLSAGNGLDSFYYDGADLHYTEPPEVELTGPVNGNTYLSGPAVELAADASSGGDPASSVDFLVDGILLKTDSQPPFTAVLLDAAPGSHDLIAVARNSIGVATTSTVVGITIDPGNGNLVDNPGFESGITDWTGHGGHTIGTTASPVYAGSNAGRAYDRDNTYDGLSQHLTGELVAGRTYVFACQVRLSESNDTCRVSVKTSYNIDSPTYQTAASAQVSDSGWTRIQGEYTFNPDPARTVTDVLFYIAAVQPPVEIFVDDVFCAETTLAVVDYDMDGMPDQWEEAWFGGIDAVNGGAFDDWDNDGVRNRAEFRSGTDPTDPASRLAIVSARPNAGQMDVDWQSVSGKTYRVLTSTNLVAGGWTIVEEGIDATGTNTATSAGTTSANQFIRIELDE